MRDRKASGWLGLALAMMLLAVACGGGDGEVQTTPTTTTTPTDQGAGLGTITIRAGEPVKIATLQAISGDNANLGEDQVRATKIAIDRREGRLLGHAIELQVEDEACSNEGGQTGAQKIVSDPQIIGTIGTSCSDAAVPASQIISQAGGVLISGSNTSPSLTARGYLEEGTLEQAENFSEGYYRTSHNDEFQGHGAAQFAYEELGARTAATVHDGDPYTEGLATEFGRFFQEFGGEVVLATAINKGDTDMRPVLTEVVAEKPDIFFFPIFQPEADFIVQQATEYPELDDVTFMGADALLSDTFVTIKESEGMYFSGPARSESGQYDDFVEMYESEFGEKPIQSFHAHAYDATNLLLDKIEEVAEQDGDTLTIDKQALRDALYATRDYDGLTGRITCNVFGDCASPRIGVYHNTDPSVGIFGTISNVVFTSSPEVKATVPERR